MEIRPLRESDDRARFRSGDSGLDHFFHTFAGQNQFKHHIGVTYVAVEKNSILGFATVAPAQLEIEALPKAERKNLPRYPIPVLRLARLATDETLRGQGLGLQLLRFVLNLALRMADDIGCTGVTVDAKPGAVPFYAKYGFVPIDVVEGKSDLRPQPQAMFLSTRVILAARKGQEPRAAISAEGFSRG
jgi:GNAT superfamily N-acetyltransferase